MPINSRNKGSRGEREACRLLEELTGELWRRSANQARLGAQMPDVMLASVRHSEGPEVKIGRHWVLSQAVVQAKRDAAEFGRLPWVMGRRDRGAWIVAVPSRDAGRLLDVLGVARAAPEKGLSADYAKTWTAAERGAGKGEVWQVDNWVVMPFSRLVEVCSYFGAAYDDPSYRIA